MRINLKEEAQVPGELVMFSGPTAVGKNTILKKFWDMKDCVKRVAHTTRAPRPGEVHGVHYYFVSREEFEARVARGEFLEWAVVHENLYGTSRLSLIEAMNSGKSVLFDLDVQGALQLKAKMPEIVSIFVLPPSFSHLRQRLDSRGSGEDEVEKLLRLNAVEEELRQAEHFDYFVVNDDLDETVLEIQKLLGILALGKKPPVDRFRNTAFLRALQGAS